MKRFNELLIRLMVQFFQLSTCCCIVRNQSAIVLITVYFKHIDGLLVWTPCYIREVTVGRITCLEVDCLAS